jgi:hypothetical protein
VTVVPVYSIGQQDTIIVTVVDRNGAVVLGEVGQVYWTGPDGVRVGPTGTTQPSVFVNNYEFDTPTFDLPGRWYWYVVFTTPNVAVDGEALVRANPASLPAA